MEKKLTNDLNERVNDVAGKIKLSQELIDYFRASAIGYKTSGVNFSSEVIKLISAAASLETVIEDVLKPEMDFLQEMLKNKKSDDQLEK